MTDVALPPLGVVEMDVSGMQKPATALTTNALEYCARKMNLASPQLALDAVHRDQMARGYFQYGLARQVASYLADRDDQISAVYLYDHDATPEDVIFGKPQPIWPLHLIVVSTGATERLCAATAALDEALARHSSGVSNLPAVAPLLAVSYVDDGEAKGGAGAGAPLKALHLPPLLIWER